MVYEDLLIHVTEFFRDAPVLDRKTLGRLRKDVEDAVARAEKLQAVTDKLLRELHDRRRTNPAFNRRRNDRRG